jgi:hypothetical protein
VSFLDDADLHAETARPPCLRSPTRRPQYTALYNGTE